jgi:hypothetical protein
MPFAQRRHHAPGTYLPDTLPATLDLIIPRSTSRHWEIH